MLSVLIYYGPQSDIRVKSYCRLNLIRASNFNLERLDILRDSIGHPSKKLLSFKFAQSFGIPFRAYWYITGLIRTSVYKVIDNSIFSELRIQILRVSIYYGTQSDIRVKSYCRLTLLRTLTFNFERLDILPDSIGHLRKMLLSFELPTSFRFQFRPSRYITGLIRTSVYKVIVNSIFSELRI